MTAYRQVHVHRPMRPDKHRPLLDKCSMDYRHSSERYLDISVSTSDHGTTYDYYMYSVQLVIVMWRHVKPEEHEELCVSCLCLSQSAVGQEVKVQTFLGD